MVASKSIEYFEAIEKRAELQQYWLHGLGKSALLDKLDYGKIIRKTCSPSLETGEIFYWSAPILDIICEAATTIPGNWTLMEDALPVPCGFFWFAKPIAYSRAPAYNSNTKEIAGEWEIRIRAISYILQASHIAIVYFTEIQTPLKAPNMKLIGGDLPIPSHMSMFPIPNTLAEVGKHKKPSAECAKKIMNEENLEKMIVEIVSEIGGLYLDFGGADIVTPEFTLFPNPQAKDNKINFFAAMLAFLQQKILTPVQQSPPRPFRRRAEREHRKLPLISIIKLRQLAYHKGEGEHQAIEYTCQWLVRGHWRDQWYPSLNRNQPIWIAPYIKGPPDKPFKGAKRLFAVVR